MMLLLLCLTSLFNLITSLLFSPPLFLPFPCFSPVSRMKPLLHPPSIFTFWVTLFIISIKIPTPLYAIDNSPYTDCNKTFVCEGSRVQNQNLKYTIWGGNKNDYCGQYELELDCLDSATQITINSITYRVLDWVNRTQMLTVARDDFWGGVCAVSDYKNSSLVNTPFQFGGSGINVNVTLLYNCSGNPLSGIDSSTCSGDRIIYYGLGSSLSYVPTCKSVVIPVLGTQASALNSLAGKINETLNQGFGLKWIGNYQECLTCAGTGGMCGFEGGGSKCHGPEYKPYGDTSTKVLDGIGLALAGLAVLVVILGLGHAVHRKIAKQTTSKDLLLPTSSCGSLAPRRYSYSEIQRITNSFLHKLGQGGYGVVYKATLPDGRLVAVKVMIESNESGEDFINEVASISRTSHVNIVKLVGFCYDTNKRALIYEFMPNGSLDNFINGIGTPNAICCFDWNTLYNIAIGIARGLEYLHRGCNTKILHLDIKPQNILLDEDFCPKIADFGLAKICKKKESIVSILGTRGTPGYIAPEVFSRAYGGVSHKSDVYSYGMLILEIVGGRKNYDSGGGSQSSEMYFPDWIYKDLEQGDVHTNYLVITEEEHEIARKMILVSLWCIQTRPSERPSMGKVVEMLEGTLQAVPYPPKPILYSPEKLSLQISDLSSSNTLETNSMTMQKDGSIELNELSKNAPG